MRPYALHPGKIQIKEGIKFCHLATLFIITSFLFNLKPFLRRTLLDHFVVGDVDPAEVSEGDQFQTVGGRNVTFTSGDGGPGRMKLR